MLSISTTKALIGLMQRLQDEGVELKDEEIDGIWKAIESSSAPAEDGNLLLRPFHGEEKVYTQATAIPVQWLNEQLEEFYRIGTGEGHENNARKIVSYSIVLDDWKRRNKV